MEDITTHGLEDMKLRIERMTKTNQIEVLKLLRNDTSAVLNENKSGIYVNLSFLSATTLGRINEFVGYVCDQEHNLMTVELQKDIFKNEFFTQQGTYGLTTSSLVPTTSAPLLKRCAFICAEGS